MKTTTDAVKLPDQEQAVPNDEPTTRQLLQMILESRKTDQEIAKQSLKQTRLRSNAQGPEISDFNPRGQKDYPMPDLAFEVLAPWPMRRGFLHGCTREEIELMNRVKVGECEIRLMDKSKVQCCIIGTRNSTSNKIEKIAFMGPRDPDTEHYTTLFTRERKQIMPSLVEILQQVLRQQKTRFDDILTMDEERERILLPSDDPQHLAVSVGE